MPQLDLASLGWDAAMSQSFLPYSGRAVPARVSRVDRSGCDVLTAQGPVRVSRLADLAPCAGDWVAVDVASGRSTLVAILPRRTALVRATASPGVSAGQVLAANVDVAFVVEAAVPEPDLARAERLLALVWHSGARPALLLTKTDLTGPTVDVLVADLERAAPGVAVYAVSALTGAGLAAVRSQVPAGRTAVLLGASGAGKSTLVNALAGQEAMATRALRADGRGRHTTTHRELVTLPGGGVLVDTPGLRSVGLFDVGDGLARTFADLEALAATCRFADCAHRSEPDCAVRAAVDSGRLTARRLESWRKLHREAAWMAMRYDGRQRAEARAGWKRLQREARSRSRP